MKRLSLCKPSRRGFTLIELLAVIAILSILLAFLLPAVFGARSRAQIVQVKTDIGNISAAINSFKQDFGNDPPSLITLYETKNGWDGGGATALASRAIISRLWPQFDFSAATPRDLDLDGSFSDATVITLSGPECLVFFLAGPTTWIDSNGNNKYDSSETVMPGSGFSRNPANPFAPLPSTGNANRQTFLAIESNRLIPAQYNTASTPIPVTYTYADPITSTLVPYLYASSNDGQGYNEDSAQLALDWNTVNAKDLRGSLSSTYTPAYYRQGTTTTAPFWNKTGYQIISAGLDRRFGGPTTGAAAGTPLGGPYQKGTQLSTSRDCERDNITNFSDGVLNP